MKKKELQEAAKELNEVLALEPEIDVEGDTVVLKEDIKNVIPLIEEDDELTIPTTDIIKELTETKKKEDKPENVEKADEKVMEEIGKDKGDATKKIVEKKSAKPTRATVMAQIFKEMRQKPLTRQEMIIKMQKKYRGSKKEAVLLVDAFIRLVNALCFLKKDKEGKYTYIGGK